MTSAPQPDASRHDPTVQDVRRMLAAARCVLFDFDGPLAGVFGGYSAAKAADVLLARIATWPHAPRLTGSDDPMTILLDVARAFGDSPDDHRVAELDRLLSDQEVYAVRSALPNAHADELVRRLVAGGRQVAVTTNNSAASVAAYLDRRCLTGCFGTHIYGRAADPRLMKPHPHCVIAAVHGLGVLPQECLLIGDSARDFQAAAAVGVPFLGLARDERKRRQLSDAGAARLVGSLAPVFHAAAGRAVSGTRFPA